jgi:hypothetical protein
MDPPHGETCRMGALLVFGVHVLAIRVLDAYSRFPSFDIPMHFLGGIAIAYFFHRSASSASSCGLIGPFEPISHMVLVFALTCTATVFWEFAEYVSDRFLGTNAQLGLGDTLLDMFLGIVGGVTLLPIARAWRRAPPRY